MLALPNCGVVIFFGTDDRWRGGIEFTSNPEIQAAIPPPGHEQRLVLGFPLRAKFTKLSGVVVGCPEFLIQLAVHLQGVAGFGPLVLAHVDKTIIGKTFGTRFAHLLGPTAERGQEFVD